MQPRTTTHNHSQPPTTAYNHLHQVVAGASASEKTEHKLGPFSGYAYVNQSGCTEVPRVDEAKMLDEFKSALKVLSTLHSL